MISYTRSDDPNEDTRFVRRDFSFDEVEAAHPGLSDTLIQMFTGDVPPCSLQTKTANVIASYLFDACSDLRIDGELTSEYPFVSNILSVRTTDDAGSFLISGAFFGVAEVSSLGIPKVRIGPDFQRHVTSEQLESIWLGGVNNVYLMEALGYDPFAVRKELNRASASNGVSTQHIDITFE